MHFSNLIGVYLGHKCMSYQSDAISCLEFQDTYWSFVTLYDFLRIYCSPHVFVLFTFMVQLRVNWILEPSNVSSWVIHPLKRGTSVIIPHRGSILCLWMWHSLNHNLIFHIFYSIFCFIPSYHSRVQTVLNPIGQYRVCGSKLGCVSELCTRPQSKKLSSVRPVWLLRVAHKCYFGLEIRYFSLLNKLFSTNLGNVYFPWSS